MKTDNFVFTEKELKDIRTQLEKERKVFNEYMAKRNRTIDINSNFLKNRRCHYGYIEATPNTKDTFLCPICSTLLINK
jgi:hypothetical protein